MPPHLSWSGIRARHPGLPGGKAFQGQLYINSVLQCFLLKLFHLRSENKIVELEYPYFAIPDELMDLGILYSSWKHHTKRGGIW